ncbi:hypothetical protein OF83DRAFT_1087518 [Amylostereum chailletii]|nr:hypothetical protein OF83DRAFT_1087518 [Amylostereum chailletii]
MAEHRTMGSGPFQRPQCPGYNRIFDRPTGLSQHLAKNACMGAKANPLCRSAYFSLPDTATIEPEPVDMPGPQAPEPVLPPAFEGDFFSRDYHEDNFGVEMDIDTDAPDDRLMPGLESDEDEDEDEDQPEEDEGDDEVDAELYAELVSTLWEPTVNPNVAAAGTDARTRTNPAEHPGRDPDPMPATEQPQQHSSIFPNSDPIIVPFPLKTAGAPLSQVWSTSEYESQRKSNNAQSGNIWAPFESKIDWTMAYWAKMRGPSSTAMTELLQMDEVRRTYYFISLLLFTAVFDA